MLNRPFACISDIHGNLSAFRVVLDELSQRAITDLLVAGDLVFGGDHPRELWQLLEKARAQCVQGPSDKALYTLTSSAFVSRQDQDQRAIERFYEVREALGDLGIMRLKRLPLTRRFPLLDGTELLLVHGSPLDPFLEISIDMSDEEIATLVNDDPADIIVCGSSHVPFQRQIGGAHIINVGSVGEAPEGQIAHLTLITPKSAGIDVEQLWLPYD
ncbi:MAG: metallophosphoesterase family protein [Myxococcales bacterium]|nr:metallophosphoesterase family protein [Myxococcales bacterium]